MIPYIGDFAEDETVYHYFNTFDSNDPSASVTITNLVDADLKVHKDGGTTQATVDGATISIDFDTITGTHLVTIDTSADAFYATGSDYMVRMEGTTVDAGTINAALFTFSIQNRYSAGALRPTTAGRTLDVTATGAAGIDWGNIENKTTANDLSGTDIQLCDTTTTVTGGATAAALATAQTDLDTITGSDGVTLATAQALYAPAKAGDSMALTTGAVDAILDETLTSHVTADSLGVAVKDILADTSTTLQAELDAIQAAVITNAAGVDIAADIIAMKAETALIVADTGELQTDWTNAGRLDAILDTIAADVVNVDGYNLATQIGTAGAGLTDLGGMSTGMKAEIVVECLAALDTAISELGVGAPSATPGTRDALMLLYMALRNKTVVQTSGTDALEIYNDAGTKIASKALTDDGSDYTEAEMV